MVSMNNNKNENNVTLNSFRWLVVVFLIVAGVVANLYYASVAWGIRASIGLVIFACALGLAASTTQGSVAMAFMKSAKVELRKVVWPTRQETMQMAMVVIAMVGIASLILWGIDMIFSALVHWLIAKGGVQGD
jgi:preprotein translocase subunit SecE